MAHLLKYKEWQGNSGDWYTGDTSDLANNSNHWCYLPTLLDLSLEDFILLLKNKFNVSRMSYYKEKNLLIYSWTSYNDCHKFTLFVNRKAKEKGFMI